MQLIAFAFGYPTEFEQTQFGMPNVIRFARLEVGERVRITGTGREVGPYYWRKWELPQEEADEMAWKVMKDQQIPAHNFRAFTLFYNGSKMNGHEPGFQMSIQMKDDNGGWSIKRITEEQADLIFQHLRYIPSPTGPWELTEDVRTDLRDSFIVHHSAVAGWEKPKLPPETEYFEGEGPVDALIGLLAAAARAVGARTKAAATLLPGEG